jgi:hypothetical protein
VVPVIPPAAVVVDFSVLAVPLITSVALVDLIRRAEVVAATLAQEAQLTLLALLVHSVVVVVDRWGRAPQLRKVAHQQVPVFTAVALVAAPVALFRDRFLMGRLAIQQPQSRHNRTHSVTYSLRSQIIELAAVAGPVL